VNLVKSLVLLLIQGWRATKHWRLPRCRFYPSCSAYAFEAIERHGLLLGFCLATVRLVKCQPLHPGGVDEVPDAGELRRRCAHIGEGCRALGMSFYHREQT
jgi:putative membrane protein insertion efficiency factor